MLQRRIILSVSVLVALCGFSIYYVEVTRDDNLPFPAVPTSDRENVPQGSPAAISKAEKEHILDGVFRPLASTEEMSRSLKDAFTAATRQKAFALANPGQKYQVTDVVEEPGLPLRRMVFAGASENKWFIYYEMGGIGHSYALVVFGRQTDGRVRFLWGGMGSERAADINELRKMIDDGGLSDQGSYYW
jgi:hypothetical protein